VKDALDYIKNQIIVERVVKVAGRAEADRFFNFPYEALEEALANACQHKSYQIP
jgi:ATP-dependent DNA helicase RecG